MDRKLTKAFRKGNVQLFVGSGLSFGVYKKTDDLIQYMLDQEVIDDCGKPTLLRSLVGARPVRSLDTAAEFYEQYTSPQELVDLIRSVYGERRNPLGIHRKLWQLPGVRMIYTTNYDSLIEWASHSPMQEPLVATKLSELRADDPGQRVVFKPHGCATRSTERGDFVVTRGDYLRYSHRHVLEELKTMHDVFTRTFIFLGYSLEDQNMRQLITEARRLDPDLRAYAVLKHVSRAEIRFWKSLGVAILESSAQKFVDGALEMFPPDQSEWAVKIESRVPEKKKIANIGVDIIKRHLKKSPGNLNIIIDSGTTCLLLVRALLREIESERIRRVSSKQRKRVTSKRGRPKLERLLLDPKRITIVTNSAPVIGLVSEATRAIGGGLGLVSVGRNLRPSTRALVFGKEHEPEPLPRRAGTRTIAFVGATSVDEKHLMTKTKEEVYAKKWFVKSASCVYVLVDHSKDKRLNKEKTLNFYTIKKGRSRRKIAFITDSAENLSIPRGCRVVDGSRGFDDLD